MPSKLPLFGTLVTAAQVQAFRKRWGQVSVEVVGMCEDPEDPEGITAAEGVNREPQFYDAILLGREGAIFGELGMLDLASDTTLNAAYAAAAVVALVLGLTADDILVR